MCGVVGIRIARTSTVELATTVLPNTIAVLFNMLNVAFCCAASVLVGSKINNGNVASAKFYALICFCCNLIVLMLACIKVHQARDLLSRALSEYLANVFKMENWIIILGLVELLILIMESVGRYWFSWNIINANAYSCAALLLVMC